MSKHNDITNMPALVAYVKMAGITGVPIGATTYERAIKEHPEYFSEEVEYRRKYAAIPEIEKEYHLRKLMECEIEKDEELKAAGYVSGIWAIINGTNNDKGEVFDNIKAKYEDLREQENERFKKRWKL
jgi:hypothetical protein